LLNYWIIKSTKLNIEQLQLHFNGLDTFETADIIAFYQHNNLALKASTVNWRIYSLIHSGVLDRVSKGKFRVGKSRNWQPEITPRISTIHKKLKKQFPYLTICMWNNAVFNEFMVHQLFKYYILVEVEKDAMESVFFYLKDSKFNVALNPDKDFLYLYFSGLHECIIVKPLISEAPLQILDDMQVQSIENLLVDVFCDDQVFAAMQGTEMQNIFKGAFSKYSVHIDRLFRYANRRGRKKKLLTYLNKESDICAYCGSQL
jgi:hypothetical protein